VGPVALTNAREVEMLTALSKASARVTRAEARRLETIASRNEMIRTLAAEGVSNRVLAIAAGLDHKRIQAIVADGS
jgi:hypothetical protein